MKKFLGACLLVVACFLPITAFAGRCAETGDCGTGSGAGNGGDGYVQRGSGLWVPNRDGYIQQKTPPLDPAVTKFGQDVARDMAKDFTKDVIRTGAAAVFAGIAAEIGSSLRDMDRSTVEWIIESLGPILPLE